ncbi:hemin uptake protein HemP [Piscinibacter sakaiensis]|uniref:Hemin uptake protein HemP n=1 Tax=Piscinibacter sakaiensis TaxID=1547922 RepID=A0A0K8P7J5_PISS1|nr:hemin uptake protein HemP [Piscinibacter sakaiensis]GAP38606.1 hypothetical protein ISF6_5159 [Piscinibacter sakaiensis]
MPAHLPHPPPGRPDDATPAATSPAAPGPTPPRRLHSEQLFDGRPEVEITHGDAVYRLRRTALGKLILTK